MIYPRRVYRYPVDQNHPLCHPPIARTECGERHLPRFNMEKLTSVFSPGPCLLFSLLSLVHVFPLVVGSYSFCHRFCIAIALRLRSWQVLVVSVALPNADLVPARKARRWSSTRRRGRKMSLTSPMMSLFAISCFKISTAAIH